MRQACRSAVNFFFFFFNDTATTEIYTLSLHDALPISRPRRRSVRAVSRRAGGRRRQRCAGARRARARTLAALRRAQAACAARDHTRPVAARLRKPDAPEIVLLTHRDQCGWLEESTMGVLRARAQRRVADADAHGRFRAYFPEPAGAKDACINIHSKVLVVDDEFLTVGSANLNNRSMGLDTECNIAVEARGEPDQTKAIASLRNRLLAEHLGVDEAQFAQKLACTGSLIATIEALRGNPRTLTPLDTDAVSELDTPLV